MSLPVIANVHEGIAFDQSRQPIMQPVHAGSALRNLGDLLLTLPAYAIVAVTIDHPTGGLITFRAMAREIAFGHESNRNERRYTMLDSGNEWFLKSDETDRVTFVTLLGQS